MQEGELQKPKRPLSAYNIFFREERRKILEHTPTRKEGKPRRSHGKIGFADLARTIASKWKTMESGEREIFRVLAARDKERYQREMDVWNANRKLDTSRALETATAVENYSTFLSISKSSTSVEKVSFLPTVSNVSSSTAHVNNGRSNEAQMACVTEPSTNMVTPPPPSDRMMVFESMQVNGLHVQPSQDSWNYSTERQLQHQAGSHQEPQQQGSGWIPQAATICADGRSYVNHEAQAPPLIHAAGIDELAENLDSESLNLLGNLF